MSEFHLQYSFDYDEYNKTILILNTIYASTRVKAMVLPFFGED